MPRWERVVIELTLATLRVVIMTATRSTSSRLAAPLKLSPHMSLTI